MKKYIMFLFFIMSFNVTALFAENYKSNMQDVRYPDLKDIKSFSSIDILLSGTAKDIGLSEEDLASYLRLRFKNSFSNIPFEEIDRFEIITQESEEKRKESGYIYNTSLVKTKVKAI
ncbi:MAG: hypothetical protein K8S27_11875 [Candidatus Omnitrophica bacterium]|nr:hypothetical protein [Candidatus Omnitrophota bacterium]